MGEVSRQVNLCHLVVSISNMCSICTVHVDSGPLVGIEVCSDNPLNVTLSEDLGSHHVHTGRCKCTASTMDRITVVRIIIYPFKIMQAKGTHQPSYSHSVNT